MTEPSFPIIDVTRWRILRLEKMGGKKKSWRERPDDGSHWLYKEVGRTVGTRVDGGGCSDGEDWAEKIVAELAALPGIPAAVVELANSDGNRGCISKSVVEDEEELVHGNELLGARDPLYPRAGQFGSWYTVTAAVEGELMPVV